MSTATHVPLSSGELKPNEVASVESYDQKTPTKEVAGDKKKSSTATHVPIRQLFPTPAIVQSDAPTASNVPLGQSKYDEGMPLGNLKDVESYRGANQSVGRAFVNGFTSRALSIVPKIGQGAGYILGALPWMATGDVTKMTENPLSLASEQLDESLREALPVYADKEYNSDSLLDVMSTPKFWFDDLFDGVAFMASAYAPGGVVGKIGSLMRASSKALQGTAKGMALLKGAQALRVANPFIMTAYNTVSESGFEARDTQKTVYEEAIKSGATEEEAKKRSSQAAANTFAANAGILLVPNFIQSMFMLGGFGRASKGMKALVHKNIDDISRVQMKPAAKALKNLAGGAVSEGLWEEGIQTAVQNYEKRMATGDLQAWENVAGYGQEWVNGFSNIEGKKSMMLGALIGGGLGAGSGYIGQRAKNKEMATYAEDWKKYLAEKVTKIDQTFTDRFVDINDPQGTISPDKQAKAFYRTMRDQDLFTEATAAAAKSDEVHDRYNKKMAAARYAHEFLSDRKNFDTTKDAVDFAIQRIDHMKEVEGVQESDLERLREDIREVGQLYDQTQKQGSKFLNATTNPLDSMFHMKANKALLYEKVKQAALKEILVDKPETEEGILALLEDSERQTKDLMSSKKRAEIQKELSKQETPYHKALLAKKQARELKQQIEEGVDDADTSLTEEQIQEKKAEVEKLSYDSAEYAILHGQKGVMPLEIATDSQEAENQREGFHLGLKDKTQFEIGMAYEKKAAREEGMKLYESGKMTGEQLVDSVAAKQNKEAAPYTKEDESMFREVLHDSQLKNKSVDPETARAAQEGIDLLEANKNLSPVDVFGTEEAYAQAVDDLATYKETAALIPKIESILKENQFDDLDKKLIDRQDPVTLQDEAMNQFVESQTEPILRAYESNKENFSDTGLAEFGLQALDIAEAGLNAEERTDLLESSKGKAMAKKIAKTRSELEKILDKAVENKSNKSVADANAKKHYGKTRAALLKDEDILKSLNKHLGGAASQTLTDLEEDDSNPAHIDKLAFLAKDLPEDQKGQVLSVLESKKKTLLDKLEKEISDAYDKGMSKDIAGIKDENMKKGAEANKQSVLQNKFPKFFKDYRSNPSSKFLDMLRSFAFFEMNDTKSRPINIFDKSVNISELKANLEATKSTEESGLAYLDSETLKRIVDLQVQIESIDALESTIHADMDLVKFFKGELDDYFLNRKAGKDIVPSRQQRISVHELLRWFTSPVKGNHKGATAYLKGLAGTGKTMVVARLFMKLSGLQKKNVLAIANNASSTDTLNKSLELDGKKTIDTIALEDITDDIKLIVVDEVGAMSSNQWDAFMHKVGKVNEKREAKDKLRVVGIGDPSQITAKNQGVVPIEERGGAEGNLVTHISPLTIPYRSDISSVSELQEMYHMNLNAVGGITVKASAPIGSEAKGVHVSNRREQLIQQVRAHKDNKRTKVVVVENASQVAAYEKELEGIPDLEVMTYIDVQGRTFGDVFIDIPPTLHQVLPSDRPGDVIQKNKLRNEVLYTATSRAQDYIFMMDTTGMKNLVSKEVTASEEKAKESYDEYKKEYVKEVQRDINILSGKRVDYKKDEAEEVVNPNPPKDGEKPDLPVEDNPTTDFDDVDGGIVDVFPDDAEPDGSVWTDVVSKIMETYESPHTPGIHNIRHTVNSPIPDLNSPLGQKMQYDKGDKVQYVLVKDAKGGTMIKIYARNKANTRHESYLELGVLSDEESMRVFQVPLKELKAVATTSIREPINGVFKRGIDKNAVVGEGTINAEPIPLTYSFTPNTKTGPQIFDEITEAISEVFEPQKYKVVGTKFKIFLPSQVKAMNDKAKSSPGERARGIQAGMPYVVVEMENPNKAPFFQYVKLAPRFVSRTEDAGALAPILEFVEQIKKIEKVLESTDPTAKLGNTSFNNLIKKFSANFQLNNNKDAIEEKKERELTYSQAQAIVPKLTPEQFKQLEELVAPVIKGYYGIGTSLVRMDETSFLEKYSDPNKYIVHDDLGDQVYYESKDTGILYSLSLSEKQRQGYIQKNLFTEKNGVKKVVPYLNKRGYEEKHVMEKSMQAQKGEAQLSLDRLAKSNESPGGVIIRTQKAFKIKGATKGLRTVTGKSLLSDHIGQSQWLDALRKVAGPIVHEKFDMSSEAAQVAIENVLVENNIATREELEALKQESISNPLTSKAIDKAFSFKESGESETMRRPLDIKNDNINELGEDLENSKEALSKLVESHFHSVHPTTVQIKVDRTAKPIAKPTKEDRKAKRKRRKASDELDDIDNARMLDYEEGMDEGKKRTKAEIVKLIMDRVPGIQPEQIQFVKDLAKFDFATEAAIGSYFDGVIYLKEDEEGKVGEKVAFHEVFHKIYAERMTGSERRRLREAFSEEFPESHTYTSEKEFEELFAKKYQDWYRGKYAPKNNFLQELFEKLRRFFRFVGNNRMFIEGVFRDITEGKYKGSEKARYNSLYGATKSLREAFNTSGDLARAINYVNHYVNDSMTNGYEGYPLSSGEVREIAKLKMYDVVKRINDEVNELEYDYRATLEQLDSAEREAELAEIQEDLNKAASKAELAANTYKYFSEIFALAYPAWDLKSTLSVAELIDEEGEFQLSLAGVSLVDDIAEWDKINMESKASSVSKNFMSNIKVKSEDPAEDGKIVPLRAAYAIALRLTGNINETATGKDGQPVPFNQQIRDRLKDETDPTVKAVGNAFIDLYEDLYDRVTTSKDIFGQETTRTIPDNGIFYDDNTLVVKNNSKDKTDLLKVKGVHQASKYNTTTYTRKVVGEGEQSHLETTPEFIERLIEETKFSKQELFDLFTHYKNRDMQQSMLSNFLSQRERLIMILKTGNHFGAKTFDYHQAQGNKIRRVPKDTIKAAVKETIADGPLTKKLSKIITAKSKNARTIAQKKDVIRVFLTEIGAGHMFGIMKYANAQDITKAYNRINYLLVKDNAFEQANALMNKAMDREFSVETEGDINAQRNADLMLETQINKEMNSLVNDLARMVDLDAKTERITSVNSATKEKKYMFVLSGEAHQVLNSVAQWARKNKAMLPSFLLGDAFKHNTVLNGKTVVYEIEDFDGTLESNDFTGDKVIEYKDEKFASYMERSFSGQFLKALDSSSKTKKSYSQNLYTISNKPANISAKVKALNPTESKAALKDMLLQITSNKSHDTIKFGDRNRIVNNNVLAEAIERVIPNQVDPAFDPKSGKFTHYKMKVGTVAKIKGKEDAIVNAAYDILLEKANEVLNQYTQAGVQMPIDALLGSNLKSVMDSDRFDLNKIQELKYQRVFDWNTMTSSATDQVAKTMRMQETEQEVVNRIRAYERAHGVKNEIAGMASAKERYLGTELADMLERQNLIPKDMLLPMISAFVVNDYINSNQLTQAISGPSMFFESSNDLTKRLSGSSAPGLRGFIDNILGMPEKSNVVILNDVEFEVGTTIRETLTKGFGLPKDQVDKLIKYYGKDTKKFEYSDGQGFMTPERFEEIKSGMGIAYSAGEVMKPAYYNVDENGVPRMLKYSTIVITDELAAASDTLSTLRENMRKQNIGEAVFASGNKVGTPKNPANTMQAISDPNFEFDMANQGFEIHNLNYRLQLNPVHNVDATVANPSQLSHFLNTLKMNAKRASKIYGATAKIIKNNLTTTKEELGTNEGIANAIKKKLNTGETNRRTLEVFTEIASGMKRNKQGQTGGISTPWNYPAITENLSVQMTSYISKSTVQVRYPGSKLVLQTAFGTEILEDKAQVKKLADTLSYKVRESGTVKEVSDILEAEVILPKGLLPKDVEARIQEAIDQGIEIPDQFIYGDLLGFRIPSSELHSAVPLKVKGFYATNVNVIIAPKTIVAHHGSDYDVDALYVIRREWDEDGNPIGYTYDEKSKKYLFDEEFLESEEFDGLDPVEQNKYLKNFIFETFMETISTKDNRYRMGKPITMDPIKEDVHRIQQLKKNKKKQRRMDSSFILDREATHASSFEALTATGIFANALKGLAYLQRAGKKGTQPSVVEELPSAENENPERRSISFEGERRPHMVGSELVDENLWDDLDSFLNSAIDNVKEGDLAELNMTSNNIKAYVALRAFGIGGENAMSVVNNLFSQNFMEVRNRMGAPAKADKKLDLYFSKILGEGAYLDLKIDSTIRNDEMERNIQSDMDLMEIFSKVDKNQELTEAEIAFVSSQAELYSEFLRALDLGSDISTVASVLGVLKEIPAFKVEVDEIVSKHNKMFTEDKDGVYQANPDFGLDISDLIKNLPHFEAAYEVVEFIEKWYGENWYRYNPSLEKAVKKAFKSNPVEFDWRADINKQKRVDEFIKFLLNGVQWDPKYLGFSYEKPRTKKIGKRSRELVAEEAFMARLVENIDILKKNPATKNNLFVSSISVESRITGDTLIAFDSGANLEYQDIIDYERAFNELFDYEIHDGKLQKANRSAEDRNMGMSRLQKDFMRYLVLKNGLVYSKTSFADVLPVRIMRIFHKAYEGFMDTLLADQGKLDALTSLFSIQLAVQKPEKLKRPDTKKVNFGDKSNPQYKFKGEMNGREIFYDAAYEIPEVVKEGDEKLALSDYPMIIKGYSKERANGTENATILLRMPYVEGDEYVGYQHVAWSNSAEVYSVAKERSAVNYDIDQAFRPDIRNIQQHNPKLNYAESRDEIPVGEIISVTSNTDPARQLKYWYKVVKSEQTKTIKGSNTNKYTLEEVPEPFFASKDSGEMEFEEMLVGSSPVDQKLRNAIVNVLSEQGFSNQKPTLVLNSAEQMVRIANDPKSPQRDTARALLMQESIFTMRMENYKLMDDIGGFHGMDFQIDTVNKTFSVRGGVVIDMDNISDSAALDEAMVHEETHRYTSAILRAANELQNANRKYGTNTLITDILSTDELRFVASVERLHEEYVKRGDPNTKRYELLKESVPEFLAYGLTNPSVMKELQSMKLEVNKSILDALLEAIMELLSNPKNIHQGLQRSFDNLMRTNDKRLSMAIWQSEVSMSTEVDEMNYQRAALKCGL